MKQIFGRRHYSVKWEFGEMGLRRDELNQQSVESTPDGVVASVYKYQHKLYYFVALASRDKERVVLALCHTFTLQMV